MPGTHTDKHNGIEIRFDEDRHTYTTSYENFEVQYLSMTAFVHKFSPEFDAKAASEAVAARQGTDPASVLAMWEEKKNAACRLGTRVHEICEDCLLGRAPRNKPDDDNEKSIMRQGWAAAKCLKEKMRIWGVEKILFDPDLRIAGTADCLAIDAAGKYWVVDWKTNAKIDDSGRGEMLAPVAHLPACNKSVYSLQLAGYEYVLRRQGYIPSAADVGRMLIHLTPDSWEVIKTPQMDVEIRDMVVSHLVRQLSPF